MDSDRTSFRDLSLFGRDVQCMWIVEFMIFCPSTSMVAKIDIS